MEQKLLKYEKIKNLVSVILPTLNSGKYLNNCLKSINNQSYDKIEIIIVDGFSSDSTDEIIKKYEHLMSIRIIKIHTNNLAEALNKAIKMSKGEFIARMDSDDMMTKNRISNQVNYLKINNQTDVLGTNAIRFNKNLLKPFILYSSNNFLKLSSIFNSPFIHPSIMIRRKVFESNFFYDETFNECEDYELWCRLRKSFNFHNLNIFGIYYRVHKTSASNNKPHQLDNYRKKILRNNLLDYDINLNDKEMLLFQKITKLDISKNDNFDDLNIFYTKILIKLSNKSTLIKTYGKDLDLFIKKKYFRFCVRSINVNQYKLFKCLDSSINLTYIQKFFLVALSVMRLPI